MPIPQPKQLRFWPLEDKSRQVSIAKTWFLGLKVFPPSFSVHALHADAAFFPTHKGVRNKVNSLQCVACNASYATKVWLQAFKKQVRFAYRLANRNLRASLKQSFLLGQCRSLSTLKNNKEQAWRVYSNLASSQPLSLQRHFLSYHLVQFQRFLQTTPNIQIAH